MFFLSGLDIPLLTCEEIFRLDDANRICPLTSQPTSYFEFVKKQEITAEQKVLLCEAFPHKQWITLNRQGMETLAAYDFQPWEAVHQLFGAEVSISERKIYFQNLLATATQRYLFYKDTHTPERADGWRFVMTEESASLLAGNPYKRVWTQRAIPKAKAQKSKSKTKTRIGTSKEHRTNIGLLWL